MNEEFAAFSTLGWDKITDITSPDERTVVMETERGLRAIPRVRAAANRFRHQPRLRAGEGSRDIQDRVRPHASDRHGSDEVRRVGQQSSKSFSRSTRTTGENPRISTRSSSASFPTTAPNSCNCAPAKSRWPIGAGSLGALRVDEALGIEGVTVLEHPSPGWSHLDLKHLFFLRHPLVRQALDFATPTQDIVDKLLKGRAVRVDRRPAAGHLGLQPEHRGSTVRPRAGQGASGRSRADARCRRRTGKGKSRPRIHSCSMAKSASSRWSCGASAATRSSSRSSR